MIIISLKKISIP